MRNPPRSPLFPYTTLFRSVYADVVADVVARTTALAEAAVAAGVDRERVLVDPGHDFGKNTRHSPEATRRPGGLVATRSEEHTSELQSRQYLVFRLLLVKKN